jgi:hypothetical protein
MGLNWKKNPCRASIPLASPEHGTDRPEGHLGHQIPIGPLTLPQASNHLPHDVVLAYQLGRVYFGLPPCVHILRSGTSIRP